MTEFDHVHAKLGAALQARGYANLTPVQEAVIAPEHKARDLLVSAQTGSGKTVAFGLTFASDLLGEQKTFEQAGAPLALIVAPTRELAMQVQNELDWLYKETKAVLASCVGGMDGRAERRALSRGAHIVVGTPGRLRDHIERGALDLSQIKVVVLDEADEMLDLGFREDLEFILDSTPMERRTLLFSATVPRTISNLAKRYQRDALRLSTAAEQRQHGDITYKAMLISNRDVQNGIINVLRYYDAQNAIIFCATRAGVARMTSRFSNRGFSVVALSGELSQEQRTHALQAMRDGRARVCIATDVAARGIDLPNLDLVVHADLPNNKETLLHRSGRTGRAGRKGTCAIMVPLNQKNKTERLLRNANIDAEWGMPPSPESILEQDDARILADTKLTDPMPEDEAEFARELLNQYGAEQVAAAFIRSHRERLSAPEELRDVSDDLQRSSRENSRNKPRKERRDSDYNDDGGKIGDFEDGRWISLSVGRNQKAEPRWLLPMLCKASNMSKRQIGTIKIRNDETYVELAGHAIDEFLMTIGPNLTIEKNIRITPIDGTPDFNREQTRRTRKPRQDKAERGEGFERKPQRERERERERDRIHERDRNREFDRRDRGNSDASSDGPTRGRKQSRPERTPSKRDDRRDNRRNRDEALKELAQVGADAPKKPKKKGSKKPKTVAFKGLKNKADRNLDKNDGGNAPRRRPKRG